MTQRYSRNHSGSDAPESTLNWGSSPSNSPNSSVDNTSQSGGSSPSRERDPTDEIGWGRQRHLPPAGSPTYLPKSTQPRGGGKIHDHSSPSPPSLPDSPTRQIDLEGHSDTKPSALDDVSTSISPRGLQTTLQGSSSTTTRRILSNPYHAKLGAPPPKPILSQQVGHTPTPLSQLPLNSRTVQFQWNKSELSTPLNRMPLGTSSNWAHSATEVTASINTQHTPYPPDTLDSLRNSIPTINTLQSTRDHINTKSKQITSTNQPITPIRPTQSMISWGTRICQLPCDTLSAEDVLTPKSSMGITVMVALLMNNITTHLLPNADGKTLHNLAHLLLTTAPDTLVKYFKHQHDLQQFVDEWRNYLDLLPVFIEAELCPCKTPLSIKNTDLRARRYDPTLRKREYTEIIMPFLHCFYPESAARAKSIFKTSYAAKDMGPIARRPGEFQRQWALHNRELKYDPPQWVDLSLPPSDTTMLPSTTTQQQPGVEIHDDTPDCISLLDGFSPLLHLGSQTSTDKVNPEELRRSALQLLPPILSQLTTNTETADYVVALATAPTTQIHTLLTENGFRAWLRTSRGTPEPQTIMRIRIHIKSIDPSWGTRGAVLRFWMEIATSLLQQMGFSLTIVKAPYDTDTQPADATNTTQLDQYTYPTRQGDSNGTVRTFDVWCVTSCPDWGLPHDSFPHKGEAVQAYFSALVSKKITIERREHYPQGMYTYIAQFSVCDRRDDDKLIYHEYHTQLERLMDGAGLPPFYVYWMSLPEQSNSAMMVKYSESKCIATSRDDHGAVSAAFNRLLKATCTKLYPVTGGYQMHFLSTPYKPSDGGIREAITAQRAFLDTHTKVVLHGVKHHNPFTVVVGPPHHDTPCSLAEHILGGTIWEESNGAIDNPIDKLTTDSTHTRYYLWANKADTEQLIRFGKFLARTLTKWLQQPPIRMDDSGALPFRREVEIPPGTSLQGETAAAASVPTTNDSILLLVQDIHRMMQGYEKDIATLKDQVQTGSGSLHIQDDIVSAVQSSITMATDTWKASLATSNEQCVRQITDTIDGFTGTIGEMCSELGRSHTQTVNTLQNLLDRYDKTAVDTYDGILCYGNEVVMLRLMVEAIVDRFNYLLRARDTQQALPEITEGAIDEAYINYMAGTGTNMSPASLLQDTTHTMPQSTESTTPTGPPGSETNTTRHPMHEGRPGTDTIATKGAVEHSLPTATAPNDSSTQHQESAEGDPPPIIPTVAVTQDETSFTTQPVVAGRDGPSPTNQTSPTTASSTIHSTANCHQHQLNTPGDLHSPHSSTSSDNATTNNTVLLTNPSLHSTRNQSSSTSSDEVASSSEDSTYSLRPARKTRRRRSRIGRSLTPTKTPKQNNCSTSTVKTATTASITLSDTIPTKKPIQQILDFRPRRVTNRTKPELPEPSPSRLTRSRLKPSS